MTMLVFIFVMMVVVPMMMLVLVMAMFVLMLVVLILQVDVKLYSFDAGLLPTRGAKMIAVDFQTLESVFELSKINPEVEQGPEKHVAADAAENIEVERFHSSSPAANALIWLAA